MPTRLRGAKGVQCGEAGALRAQGTRRGGTSQHAGHDTLPQSDVTKNFLLHGRELVVLATCDNRELLLNVVDNFDLGVVHRESVCLSVHWIQCDFQPACDLAAVGGFVRPERVQVVPPLPPLEPGAEAVAAVAGVGLVELDRQRGSRGRATHEEHEEASEAVKLHQLRVLEEAKVVKLRPGFLNEATLDASGAGMICRGHVARRFILRPYSASIA